MGKSSYKPKNVNGQFAIRTQFYKQVIRNIIKGIFKITVPEGMTDDYILNTLIYFGYVIFTDTEAGVLGLRGTVTGNNYLYMPTGATIVVPGLKEMRRKIGKDCELLYLERTTDGWFYTFRNLIDVYAEKFASADAAIDVNLMNSRAAFMVQAETKAQAQTIKTMYAQISEGEPLVVYKENELSKDGLQAFFGNVRNNFIVTELQDAKRSIMNELLTVLGVNNANTDKRERLITNEVDSNNIELAVNVGTWKRNMKNCTDKIKTMFPNCGFSIELAFDPEERSVADESSDVRRTVGNDSRGE